MKSWAKWTAKSVLVTTGFAAASCGITGVAFAGTGGTNTGNVSALDENLVNAPVSVPADICGNAAAILGIATAGCQGGASVAAAHTDAAGTSGSSGPEYANISIGHGNTVKVPVIVAADACGNSVGGATAKCHGGIHLPASSTWQNSSNNGTMKQAGMAAGNLSVGDGNDVQVPVTAPIDACGNAAAVLGDSSAGCEGGATIGGQAQQAEHSVKGGPLKKVTKMTKVAKVTQAAALGTVPGIASLPALGGVSGLPVFSGLTGENGVSGQNGLTSLTRGASKVSTLMPANTLAAAQQGTGMSDDSFASLAIGVLLAGAAALKLASRRPRSRKARTGQVSA